mmetsp:Transcript_32866/g.75681  ORF Transcript_32866/g.75681 Transcript_32866/m.75681 type:complete len:85 (+) Transcript_32866:1683-1937(+)
MTRVLPVPGSPRKQEPNNSGLFLYLYCHCHFVKNGGARAGGNMTMRKIFESPAVRLFDVGMDKMTARVRTQVTEHTPCPCNTIL